MPGLRWSQVQPLPHTVSVIRPSLVAGGESSLLAHSKLEKTCGDPYPLASSHSLARMNVAPSLWPRYSPGLRSVSWFVTKDSVLLLLVRPEPAPKTSRVARLPVFPLPV